jgi:hypothetical protein
MPELGGAAVPLEILDILLATSSCSDQRFDATMDQDQAKTRQKLLIAVVAMNTTRLFIRADEYEAPPKSITNVRQTESTGLVWLRLLGHVRCSISYAAQ